MEVFSLLIGICLLVVAGSDSVLRTQDIDMEGRDYHETFGEKITRNLRSLLEAGSDILKGSNCVFIENGVRTPFSKCNGCKIEEAVNCIEDMRFNRSGAVPAGCNLNTLMQSYEPQCCPETNEFGRLAKRTSAYPFAFTCLAFVGCLDSPVAEQLKEECISVCDPDGAGVVCNPYPDYSQDREVICFAGSETVEHETKGIISIKDVIVGDRILSANMHGETKFSSVVAVPHEKNRERVAFIEITTQTGLQLRMSRQHLLPVGPCTTSSPTATFPPLVPAHKAQLGECVYNSRGEKEEIITNIEVQGEGIYSVVTEEQLVVVGGIIASPFAVWHEGASFFYDLIFRPLYKLLPQTMKTAEAAAVNHFFSNALIYYFGGSWA